MFLNFEKTLNILKQELLNVKVKNFYNFQVLIKKVRNLKKKIKIEKNKIYLNLTRWQKVQISRYINRPCCASFIHNISDSFIELHGDRCYSNDSAIIGGVGTIGSQSIMFIGNQKGRNIKERKYRNFSMPHSGGYKKSLRLMKLAEKFNKPIVIFIDTPGAYPGLIGEKKCQAESIAKNIKLMFSLKVPIISIIIGEGGSGGALGIGVADKILMLENSWYSVISPESCSSILWKNRNYKERSSDVLKLTGLDMLDLNFIDEVISEPKVGIYENVDSIFLNIKKKILNNISFLKEIFFKKRIKKRIKKFYTINDILKY